MSDPIITPEKFLSRDELPTEAMGCSFAIIGFCRFNEMASKLFAEPLSEKVRSESYLPVKIEIKNNQASYLPLNIILTKAPGLYGSNKKSLMLKPNEEKVTFFIIEIPEAERNYIYSAVIEVKTQFNNIKNKTIIYSEREAVSFSLEEAEEIATQT